MAVANDATHALLRKARPLAQSGLDAFLSSPQAVLPPAEYGTYEVREVDVQSALTLCRMPGEPWSLNPYTGCSHACAYCYVPDVAHVQRERWGRYVLVKRNLPRVLSREVRRRERRPVFLSSATDPYQPAEATHQVTRRCLDVLARVDWPLRVLTRNPLVRRDVDRFRRFSDLEVGMSVPTLDDEVRRLVEPGAPPIEGRLRALRALADAGFAPYVNVAPAYPLTGGLTARDLARAFAEAGVRQVSAWPWRYFESVRPFLREALAGTAYEELTRAVEDAGAYRRMFADLARELRARGLGFSAPGHAVAPQATGS